MQKSFNVNNNLNLFDMPKWISAGFNMEIVYFILPDNAQKHGVLTENSLSL